MTCSKKVIITGATGLIGKEAIEPLIEAGFEIFALVRKPQKNKEHLNYIECDIFDDNALKDVFENIKPTYLLHFAWDTQQGYLESDSNYKFLEMSLKMLEYFKNSGGKRAVYAGTCFEYEFKDAPLKETDKLNPVTTYAKCKNELREKAESYCSYNNISFGWGRIFYVYGRNEHPNRLTQHIINSMQEKKTVEIKCGQLIKDYMYTKDIAAAFVKLLESNVTGCVNICTGKGILLSDYAIIFARELDGEKYLSVKNEQTNQPPIIVGDNSRLINEVQYKIKYSLQKAIRHILKEKL